MAIFWMLFFKLISLYLIIGLGFLAAKLLGAPKETVAYAAEFKTGARVAGQYAFRAFICSAGGRFTAKINGMKETPNLNNLKDELRAEVEVRTNDLKIPPAALEWFEQVERPVIAGALENFCLKKVFPVGVFLSEVKHGSEHYEELVLCGENDAKEKINFPLAKRKVKSREA